MTTKQPLPPAIADMMLGRLVKWLRLIGADVAYQNPVDDDELVHRAREESRLLMTRDTHLRTAGVDVLFIEHDRIENQLRQVYDTWDLTSFHLFSRCTECNVEVVEVKKEEVKDRLWPYVCETQERIHQCPECERLYWRATHRSRALDDLGRMLGKDLVQELTATT